MEGEDKQSRPVKGTYPFFWCLCWEVRTTAAYILPGSNAKCGVYGRAHVLQQQCQEPSKGQGGLRGRDEGRASSPKERLDKWQWKKKRPAKGGPPLKIHPQQVSVVRLSVGGKMRDTHIFPGGNVNCWTPINREARRPRSCLCLTVCIGTHCFMRRGGLRWGGTGQGGGGAHFSRVFSFHPLFVTRWVLSVGLLYFIVLIVFVDFVISFLFPESFSLVFVRRWTLGFLIYCSHSFCWPWSFFFSFPSLFLFFFCVFWHTGSALFDTLLCKLQRLEPLKREEKGQAKGKEEGEEAEEVEGELAKAGSPNGCQTKTDHGIDFLIVGSRRWSARNWHFPSLEVSMETNR